MRGSLQALHNLDDPAWAALPSVAEAHGLAALTPIVEQAAPPSAVVAALRDLTTRTTSRSARLDLDRHALSTALESAAVPFKFLKGAWLAELGLAPATRPAADIDIYAPAEALASVHRALTPLGYRLSARAERHRTYVRRGNRAVVDARGEHPSNPRPVEVHPRVSENFRGIRLDLTDRLPAGRVPMPIALGAAHVAAHATVDALGRKLRMVSLLDIAALARAMTGHDWARFEEQAASARVARFVWPALELAVANANAPVPDRVRENLAHFVGRPMAAWVSTLDVYAASRLGRADTKRAVGEIPAIWPISRRETAVVWRAILFPGRWDLADRYPRQAAGALWPLMYGRHAVYNARVLAARWRLRS